ncbi:MAG: DinB family protein [Phycisphaerales bacterium]|nr:DinB family protein [Phycisphaerales bacterium]
MSIAHAMLGEFEQESTITRKFLERIPADKLGWKPHEKSHTAGALALHIANVPGGVVKLALVDASPLPDFAALFKQPASVQEILTSHEKSTQTVREILPTLDDARLMTDWSALREGKPVLTIPKVMVLRSIMLNHWIQHRGQLGVYLRLVGAKVPASYGPSGDEM